MGIWKTFFVVILSLTVVWLVFFGIHVKNMKEPQPGNTKECSKTGKWSDDACLIPQELAYDPTLLSPTGKKMQLISFVKNTQLPFAPYYNPVWYRFRYVNTSTGGYSNFSDWTQAPVMSGSCCLPCVNGISQNKVGVCPQGTPTGFASCGSNYATLGILESDLDYSPLNPLSSGGGNVVASVHVYVGKSGDMTQPADDVNDTIIGFITSTATNIQGSKYATFIDMSDPCGKGNSGGGVCKKNQQCSSSFSCSSDVCNQFSTQPTP